MFHTLGFYKKKSAFILRFIPTEMFVITHLFRFCILYFVPNFVLVLLLLFSFYYFLVCDCVCLKERKSYKILLFYCVVSNLRLLLFHFHRIDVQYYTLSSPFSLTSMPSSVTSRFSSSCSFRSLLVLRFIHFLNPCPLYPFLHLQMFPLKNAFLAHLSAKK